MTKNIIAAALFASSLLAAVPAAAAQQEAEFRITVPVADLNLDTEEGQRTAAKRAVAAAGELCGPAISFRRSDELAATDCREGVRASAKAAAARRAATAPQQIASR